MDSLEYTDYSRQNEMDEEMGDHLRDQYAHIVVGCGGVGFWLAFMLAMNGIDRLIVCDGQNIEASNLNRIPVPQTWIGKNKTIALRKLIKQVRPECIVSIVPKHVLNDDGFQMLMELAAEDHTNDGHLVGARVLWDCTDDARVQKKLATFCRQNSNVVYRKLGYEGYRMGSYMDMQSVWVDEETYQPGYRTSKANAMSSAMTAALGIFALGLQHDEMKDLTIDVKTIVQSGGTQCTSTTRTNTRPPQMAEVPRRAGIQAQNLVAPTAVAMARTR